ncbi:hypothetical protein M2232_009243 [Bradyrhizobium japonicum]|uniref:hypothetical protein n=1 Tax=Bradyrhizobium japonicum TaxID=375 RepID=UPI0022275196|nr:hypothetical protein [Bradyrhizobium japonicum]MCW2225711.1 hypothetical protein [Bradyrhizobium japonicum]MCW2340923.1 hypothetical protein [Bradyrhizobium japonicum]
MSFGLTLRQYLDLAEEARSDFQADHLSLRKLISVCVLTNHLPEIVFAEHAAANPLKVHGQTRVDDYRNQIVQIACPSALIIRDLCDYAKHGPRLRRSSVQVDQTGKQTKLELDTASFLAGAPNHQEVERFVVTLRDGTERLAEDLVRDVVNYWNAEFVAHGL